jgi:superfamily II DNA or RNA helicase
MASKAPYKWQESAFMRCVRAIYFGIVADCGCGKTLAAIKIAVGKMMPVIVIAPGHRLCDQWKDAIIENAGPDEEIWLYAKPEEAKQGEGYKERFERWLRK